MEHISMDNIKVSELKGVIKTIVRESISERSQAQEACKCGEEGCDCKKDKGDQIPKGKLAQLNPKIANKGDKGKMKLPPKVKEAGLTSEKGEVEVEDDMDDESTDEAVSDHIAALLQAVFNSEKTRGLSNSQKVALVKKIVDRGVDSLNLKEASYKQVSPNETDTAAEDKARKIQTEPKVNEASYKVVAPRMATDAKEDKARKIQTEPKVNENTNASMLEKVKSMLKNLNSHSIPPVLPGRDEGTFWVRYPNNTVGRQGSELLKPIATEYGASGQGGLDYLYHLNNVNETAYKTQGPSLKTFEDSPQFPKAVNDPENA